jgi:hypothetical protein
MFFCLVLLSNSVQVAVSLNNGGQVSYQDVYAFGHKDAKAVAEFVQLTLIPVETIASDISGDKRVLELSALHYAAVVQAGTGPSLGGDCHKNF